MHINSEDKQLNEGNDALSPRDIQDLSPSWVYWELAIPSIASNHFEFMKNTDVKSVQTLVQSHSASSHSQLAIYAMMLVAQESGTPIGQHGGLHIQYQKQVDHNSTTTTVEGVTSDITDPYRHRSSLSMTTNSFSTPFITYLRGRYLLNALSLPTSFHTLCEWINLAPRQLHNLCISIHSFVGVFGHSLTVIQTTQTSALIKNRPRLSCMDWPLRLASWWRLSTFLPWLTMFGASKNLHLKATTMPIFPQLKDEATFPVLQRTRYERSCNNRIFAILYLRLHRHIKRGGSSKPVWKMSMETRHLLQFGVFDELRPQFDKVSHRILHQGAGCGGIITTSIRVGKAKLMSHAHFLPIVLIGLFYMDFSRKCWFCEHLRTWWFPYPLSSLKIVVTTSTSYMLMDFDGRLQYGWTCSQQDQTVWLYDTKSKKIVIWRNEINLTYWN